MTNPINVENRSMKRPRSISSLIILLLLLAFSCLLINSVAAQESSIFSDSDTLAVRLAGMTTVSEVLDLQFPEWEEEWPGWEKFPNPCVLREYMGHSVFRYRFYLRHIDRAHPSSDLFLYAKNDTILMGIVLANFEMPSYESQKVRIIRDSAAITAWRHQIWESFNIAPRPPEFTDSILALYNEGGIVAFGYNCGFGADGPVGRWAMNDVIADENYAVAEVLVASFDASLRLYGYEVLAYMNDSNSTFDDHEERVADLIGGAQIDACGGCMYFTTELGASIAEELSRIQSMWIQSFDGYRLSRVLR